MKAILVFFFCLISWLVTAQDSLSHHSRSFRFYAGAPFQKNWNEGSWFTPNFEIGFDMRHAIKLKNSYYISFGLGARYSQYRSEAYVLEWTTLSYSPSQGVSYHSHSDDFERQTVGRFWNFRVPIQLEYVPSGRLTPYAKVGVSFDVTAFYNSVEVYAHSVRKAPVYFHANPKRVNGDLLLLSAISSGGVKYQKGNTAFLVGIYGQVGFWNFDKDSDVGRLGVGAEFTLRRTIPHSDFPHNEEKNTDLSKKGKDGFFYAEAGGSSFGSLNYDRNLIQNNGTRLNVKAGVGMVGFNGLNLVLPLGFSWIAGGEKATELGVDWGFIVEDISESYVAPRIGYRREFESSMIFRATLAGWWMVEDDGFFVVPGFSIGRRL